jgi:hypothetical protein
MDITSASLAIADVATIKPAESVTMTNATDNNLILNL